MLSRTASELYWMSRHLERAENTARMLDVTQTMSLMPSIDADHSELVAPLTISGTHEPFLARYGQVNMENLLQFSASTRRTRAASSLSAHGQGQRPRRAGQDPR
jgi:uncharacterized alpha-E superfamily protein